MCIWSYLRVGPTLQMLNFVSKTTEKGVVARAEELSESSTQCRHLNNKQLHFGNGRPPHPSRLGGMKQLSGASANS